MSTTEAESRQAFEAKAADIELQRLLNDQAHAVAQRAGVALSKIRIEYDPSPDLGGPDDGCPWAVEIIVERARARQYKSMRIAGYGATIREAGDDAILAREHARARGDIK